MFLTSIACRKKFPPPWRRQHHVWACRRCPISVFPAASTAGKWRSGRSSASRSPLPGRSTLLGRVAETLGQRIDTPWPEMSRCFPTSADLLAVPGILENHLGPLGITSARSRCIVRRRRGDRCRPAASLPGRRPGHPAPDPAGYSRHRPVDGRLPADAGTQLAGYFSGYGRRGQERPARPRKNGGLPGHRGLPPVEVLPDPAPLAQSFPALIHLHSMEVDMHYKTLIDTPLGKMLAVGNDDAWQVCGFSDRGIFPATGRACRNRTLPRFLPPCAANWASISRAGESPSPFPWPPSAAPIAARSGPCCKPSLSAAPPPTEPWQGSPTSLPRPRPGPSAAPSATIPSPSSSPATGWSAVAASSPATPEVWSARRVYWIWSAADH
jgi:hypothetical protein